MKFSGFNTTEKVGIGVGTSVPEKDLTVQSATSPAIGLYSTYADTNSRNWAINTNNSAYGDFTISTSAARLGNPTTIKMSILKDGKVGIGTASPDGTLHVETGSAGTITAEAYADDLIIENSDHVGISLRCPDAKDGFILFQSATNDRVARISAEYNGGDENLAFAVDDDNKMVINDSGNVGIGTTSPAYNLHIKPASGNARLKLESDSNTADVEMMLDSASSTRNAHITFYNAGTQKGGVGYVSSDTIMKMWGSNNPADDHLCINSSGSVGIGTPSPSVGLEVAKTSADASFKVNRTDQTNIQLIAAGSSYVRASAALILQSNGANNRLTLAADGSSTFSGSLKATTILDSSNSAGTNGQVLTSTGSALDWKTLSEISGVDGSGTANYIPKWTDADTIGNSTISDNASTVTVASDFHVYKVGSDKKLWLSEGTSGSGLTNVQLSSNGVSYLKGGSVGIGTNAPGRNLHIKGALAANNTVATKVENTGTGFAGLDLATDGTDWSILAWGSGTATPNQLSFYNGSTHPLSILSDGKVGIGTSSPSRILTINDATLPCVQLCNGQTGTATGDGYQMQLSGVTGYLYNYDGQIIFGTSNAVALTLDTSQNATFNGLIKAGNLSISSQEIDVSSGDLILDVAGTIKLDSDNGTFYFQDGGTIFGIIEKSGTSMRFRSGEQDGDMIFMGNDGGTNITALTLDMSASGAATFNDQITLGGNLVHAGNFTLDVGGDITLDADGGDWKFQDAGTSILEIQNDGNGNAVIIPTIADKDIKFLGNDGGSTITALLLDMSDAGAAIFNSDVRVQNGAKLKVYRSGNSAYAGVFMDTGEKLYIRNSWANKDIVMLRTGEVGIGTDSPSATLDVVTPASSTVYAAEITQSNTSNGDGLYVNIGSTSANDYVATFRSSNNNIFDIKGNGQVGVNQPSPAGTFHIVAKSGTTGLMTVGAASNNIAHFYTSASATALVIDSDGEVGIGTNNPTQQLMVWEGSSSVSLGEYSNGAVIWLDGVNGDLSGGDYFNIWADGNSALRFGYGTGQKVSMLSSGRFGIGVDTPSNLLSVEGSVSGDYLAEFKQGYSTAGQSYGVNITAGTNASDQAFRVANQAQSTLMEVRGDGEIRVAGQTLVDSANTNYNMTFPNMGGIAMGSAYTYANIYGSGGDLYLKANAYAANLGANPSKIYLVTAGNSGSTAPDVVVKGGIVGIGTDAPDSLGLNIASASTDPTASYTGNSQLVIGLVGSTTHKLAISRDTDGDNAYIHSYQDGVGAKNLILQPGGGIVGIGTTAPGAKLHVYGSSAETTIAKIDGSLRMGVLNSYIKGPNDYKLLRFTNSGLVYNEDGAAALDFRMEGDTNINLFLLDASADSIGIGAAPISDASLYVAGSKTYPLRVQTTNAQYYFADSVIYANSANGMYIVNQSQYLRLGANNAEVMRLTGGSVGIGTTTPSTMLEVKGTNAEIRVHSTNENVNQSLISIGSDLHATNSKDSWIRFYSSQSSTDRTFAAGAIGGKFKFNYIATRATAPTGGTTVLTLDGVNDRVGIGTDAPASELQINGSHTSVNENAPYGTNSTHINLKNTSDTDGNLVGVLFEGAVSAAYMGGMYMEMENHSSFHSKLHFATRNDSSFGSKMVLAKDGNVGIGTTNPPELLSVMPSTGDAALAIYQVGGNANNFDCRLKFMKSDGWQIESPKYSENSNSKYDFGVNFNRDQYSGDFYIANNGTKRIKVDSSGHLLPGANGTYNLGSSGAYWKNAYLEDTSINGTLYVGGALTTNNSIIIPNASYYFGAKNTSGTAIPLMVLNSSNAMVLGGTSMATNAYPIRNIAKYITFEPAGGLGTGIETMRITNSSFAGVGSVGIGTTAPEAALHVVGGIHLNNASAISWDQAGGTLRNAIRVDSGDDLHIGDTNFDDIRFSTGQKTDCLIIKQTTGNIRQAGGAYEWYDGSGAKVGEISTIGGNNLTISGTQTNHCGLSFATNAILPATQSATNNNTVDLGANGNAFKDFYIQGTAYVRNSGGHNVLWGKGTGWGYSPNSYRAIQIGDASGNNTVSIGYDPAGNTSGAFTGDGGELLFRNNFTFQTPNSANDGWHKCMHFQDGKVQVGSASAASSPLEVTIPATQALTDYGGVTFQETSNKRGLSMGWDNSSEYFWFYSRDVGTASRGINLNNSIYIKSAGGNVGIGVNAPTSKLHVTGDTGNSAFLTYIFNSGTQSEDNGLNVQIASSGTSAMALRVNTGGNSNALIVTGSGNVGLGYTAGSITEKFCVNGKTRLQSSGDGNNVLECIDSAGDAMFNIRQSNNDCLIRAYKDGGTQTIQLHSDGESYLMTAAGGGTDLQIGGSAVTSHGTVVMANGTGASIAKIRVEGSDDSFYLSKIAGSGKFYITSDGEPIVLTGGDVQIGTATTAGGKLMVSNSDNTVYDASQASHQRDEGSTLMINNESLTTGSFSQIVLRNRSSNVGGCRIVSIESGSDNSELAIVTGDTGESMRIKGDGKVGIGTTNPTNNLVVYATGHQVNFVTETDDHSGMRVKGADAKDKYILFNDQCKLGYQHSTATLHLCRSGAFGDNHLVINSNGNVGIGTATPGKALEVIAAGNSDGIEIGSSSGHIRVIDFTRTSTSANPTARIQVMEPGATHTSDMRFYTSDAVGGPNLQERMIIDSDGSVGIGTNNPGTLLHVNGAMQSKTLSVLGDGTSLPFLSTSGGNNMGTFYSTLTTYARLRINIAGTGDAQVSFMSAGTTKWSIGNDAGDSHKFKIKVGFGEFSGAEKFMIQADGNIGIGTNAAGYKFHVQGDILASGSIMGNSKSFVIDHPTKPNNKLQYGALEGPEFGVYHRGRAQSNTITLPDYWTALVREETITVQLTPKGSFQHLYVVSQSLTEIVIGAADGETIDCFYTVYGERADIDSLVVEKEV